MALIETVVKTEKYEIIKDIRYHLPYLVRVYNKPMMSRYFATKTEASAFSNSQ